MLAAQNSPLISADPHVTHCEKSGGIPRVLTPIRLWHLCSLDAPSVATCWTALIAQVGGISLPWSTLAAMFLAVWIIYAADRLLDARDGTVYADQLEERHDFHRRHWRPFAFIIVVCALLLAGLVFRFEHTELQLFSALGVLLIAYCLLIHARSFSVRESLRVPKEFAVGAFFAAALFIPTVARAPELRSALFPLAVLLSLVCTLNCTLIYVWEHQPALEHAHWTTRFISEHVTLIICLILVLAALVSVRHTMLFHAPEAATALAVSTLCFILLHAFRKRIGKADRRALIDFALLLPPGLLLLQSLLA